MAELHAKGLANIVIAKRLGIADTTVSQDLLFLGLRTKTPPPTPAQFSLAEVYAAQRGVAVDELMTAHGLAKLDQVSLQALFLDGLTPRQRGAMTGKAAAFTLAELSYDTLIAAILRQREKTAAPAYPRVPAAASAPTTTPLGRARAGAGGSREVAARPVPPDLGAGGAGKDTGDAARPEPARRAS